MFERRVRIMLALLVVVALALLLRAAQVQVAQAGHWKAIASQTMHRSELTETTRGRILDVKGRVLAADEPCNDAAVAYWFITEEPDEQRLYSEVARKLARQQTPGYASLSRDEQHKLVLSFMPQARQKLEEMWDTLAEVGGVSRAEIDARRQEIVNRVALRREQVFANRFKRSLDEHKQQANSPWWRRWLLGEADAPPELEAFEEPIAEELQAHVILPNIPTEAYNELRKRLDELPGVRLPASQTRSYPGGNATAHLVGFLNAVTEEDLRTDPNAQDKRRAYLPRDQIGRSGLEQLAERDLRGSRGRIDADLETGEVTVAFEKVAGQDVKVTIDLELQQEVRNAFQNVQFAWPDEHDGLGKVSDPGPFPGAAVIIEVETGAILTLASYFDYDPNTYQQESQRLSNDYINQPLRNRAMQFATVPGSTIKPLIGLAAVAEGLLDPHETIECNGYMHVNGEALSYLRCWTASMYGTGHQGHPTPGLNPGFEPPPGHLTLADALQRSCNVFFETAALRLGEPKLTKWMKAFGLGSTSGIGLPEQPGQLLDKLSPEERRSTSEILHAGIGQGNVQATPLQMANVAATLARGGVVIRPTLLQSETERAVKEKKDLQLNPRALEMVRRGMAAAVQQPGGTGNSINKSLPLAIAGKTGSAQAHPLTAWRHDAQGNIIRDENGKPVRFPLKLSTRGNLTPEAPWFRRSNPSSEAKPSQAHSWVIGYAPAENPQVAFAVLVEYGGSGSDSAGSVVAHLMDALVRLKYITPTRQPDPNAEPGILLYLLN